MSVSSIELSLASKLEFFISNPTKHLVNSLSLQVSLGQSSANTAVPFGKALGSKSVITLLLKVIMACFAITAEPIPVKVLLPLIVAVALFTLIPDQVLVPIICGGRNLN